MTPRSMMLFCLLAAPAGLVLVSGPAKAQLNTFGLNPNTQRLTDADRRMLWQSAQDLNEAASVRPGNSRSWNNPQSGNSGTVTMERAFRSGDMPCHALLYNIARKTSAPQSFRLNWCRTKAGEWKIAP